MYENIVLEIAHEAVYTIIIISAPILGAALLIGLLISILQATTQIQEITLVFVPKIIVVLIVTLVFSSWMLNILTDFTQSLYLSIPQILAL